MPFSIYNLSTLFILKKRKIFVSPPIPTIGIKMKKYAALYLFMVLCCNSVFPAFAENTLEIIEKPPLVGQALVEALRQGGYVLFMRHASTEHIKIDRSKVRMDDCSTQRNLSAQGRQEAEDIGKAFKQLAIPVGEVISSPYCRCHETAQLAFGKARIDTHLRFTIGENETETAALKEALTTLLVTPPQTATNTVLISHTGNLKETTGIWPKPEGVIAVFKPLEQGQVAFLGLLAPPSWSELLK